MRSENWKSGGTPVSPVPDLARRVREAALLEGDFLLSSGKRSSFYVDKYLFSTEPDLLREVAGALARTLPDGVDRLAGIELGAVPLVTAVALHTSLPYIIVRKSAKEYGTGKGVEGRLEAGERVALIEDVVTTGTQAVEAARRLSGADIEVAKISAVLDRREEASGYLEEFLFGALLRMDDLRVDNDC